MMIYLVGMPAAGKTHLATKMAQKFRINTLDLDEYIVGARGQSVADIFAKQGEATFREYERDALRNIFSEKHLVIATGGGTPCFHNNMEFMCKNGLTLFLDMPLAQINKRILKDKQKRPLFAEKSASQIQVHLKDLYQKRLPFYRMAQESEQSTKKCLEIIEKYIL